VTLLRCPHAPACRTWINLPTAAEADRAMDKHLRTEHKKEQHMSITLDTEYENDAPTEHNRVEADVWAMDCIYGDCEHATEADADAERPLPTCPTSKAIVCQECSERNSEYEGGIEPWPCQNQALQVWQAAGGPERQYDTVAEAFLRGWDDYVRRARAEAQR
jgi:hypothetical protein